MSFSEMSQTVQLRAVRSAHSSPKPLRTVSRTVTVRPETSVGRAKSALVIGSKQAQSPQNLRQVMSTQNVQPQQYKQDGRLTSYREESDCDSARFSGDSNEMDAIKLEKQAELQLATHELKQLLVNKKIFKQYRIIPRAQKSRSSVETKQKRKSAIDDAEQQQEALALTRILRDQYNARKTARMLKIMRSFAEIPKTYRQELVCEWLAANELLGIAPKRNAASKFNVISDHEWNPVDIGAETTRDGATAARERWDLFSERMPHHVLLENYSDSLLQSQTLNFQTKERMVLLIKLNPQLAHRNRTAKLILSRFLTNIKSFEDECVDVSRPNPTKSGPVKAFGLVLYFSTVNSAVVVIETDVQQNLQILQNFLRAHGIVDQIKILQVYSDVQLAPGSGFVHGFDVSPAYSQRVANSKSISDEKSWIHSAARVAYSVTQLSTMLWPYSDDSFGRDQLLQEWQNLPNSFDFNPAWLSTLISRDELQTPFERLTQHRELMLFDAVEKVSGLADTLHRKSYFYWQAYKGTEL